MTTPAEIVTRNLEGTNWHIVSYSPRGFANELATAAFMERKNAETFIGKIQDEGGWIVTGSQAGLRARDWDADTIISIWDISEQY